MNPPELWSFYVHVTFLFKGGSGGKTLRFAEIFRDGNMDFSQLNELDSGTLLDIITTILGILRRRLTGAAPDAQRSSAPSLSQLMSQPYSIHCDLFSITYHPV